MSVKQKRCYKVKLSRQEGSTMRNLANAQSGTGLPMATQDNFFCRLAGRSVPSGLAIVHWVGCINAIKFKCMVKQAAETIKRVLHHVLGNHQPKDPHTLRELIIEGRWSQATGEHRPTLCSMTMGQMLMNGIWN